MFSTPTSNTGIRLVTYNILSPKLCNSKAYTTVDPDVVNNNDARKERIMKKLREAMETNDIICLQEMSISWSGDFQLMFENVGWTYTFFGHGHVKNGYMGNVMAINQTYSSNIVVKDIAIAVPSNFIKEYPKDTPPPTISTWNYMKSFIVTPAPVKKYIPFWGGIKTRRNAVIMTTIAIKGSKEEIIVANYHSPCVFGSRQAEIQMCIFAQLLLSTVYAYAHGREVIIAGDFNIKPDDPAYNLIENGCMDPKDYNDLPDATSDEMRLTLVPVSRIEMKSIYRLRFPQTYGDVEDQFYTCCSQLFDNEFVGVLDHIFVSKGLRSTHMSTPTLSCEHQPNRSEPSDHVMLSCIIDKTTGNITDETIRK
jgi:mRNA deadenylase 3'-5' endonuclease subunit Ccr4